jgi:hypothetical protein
MPAGNTSALGMQRTKISIASAFAVTEPKIMPRFERLSAKKKTPVEERLVS